MANIQPVQNFVLVQFIPKNGSKFFMPDGSRNPSSHCVVLAVGPDVPQPTPEKPNTPRLMEGMKVLLRGDAKVFGVEGKADTACIPYAVIMAIDQRKKGEEEEEMDEAKIEHLLQSIPGN